ncbi:hypothetical protein D6089_09630 [Vibrio vulnificus]|nr:hypothetical protein [Vibrio vulnificus]
MGEIAMDISAKEIRALEAAIDQFSDMIGAGSEDERHEEHLIAFTELLRKAKACKRSKKLVVTDAQIKAIFDQFTDCHSMIGGGDYDVDKRWARNQQAVNRMFKANSLPVIE